MSNTSVTDRFKGARVVALLSIIAGAFLIIAGGVTWGAVATQLKAEKITVASISEENPGSFAGKTVQDPFTAYAQANAINEHSLSATGDLTYAELGEEITALKAELADSGESDEDIATNEDVLKLQGQRTTIMNGSFLRASLFTSVVSFGIAALVMGLGILFVLVGYALRVLARKPDVAVVAPVEPTPAV